MKEIKKKVELLEKEIHAFLDNAKRKNSVGGQTVGSERYILEYNGFDVSKIVDAMVDLKQTLENY